MGRKMIPAEVKLSRFVVDAESGCHRWQGAHNWNGYGLVTINRVMMGVHRAAYELLVGPIPEGYEVDHVRVRGCKHRDCINPEHLEAVTKQENRARVVRGCTRADHRKTVRLDRDGRERRNCATCRSLQYKERKEANRA
jgi:hypothetical protein